MQERKSDAVHAPGTVLGGRFEVRALLGEGGMGAVYAAWDTRYGREIALKLMRNPLSRDPRALARFQREGELLARVRHPAIVGAYETSALPDGTPFMALELLHGETLADRIERDGAIAPGALVPILDEICDALGAAHARGLVHRDIKPSNLFLVAGGSGPTVRLLDFGIAKPVDLERLTSTGVVVGTVLYMAPEQLAGQPVDARCDVYALGVVLHEALTGRHPFSASGDEHLSTAILVGRASPIGGVTREVAAVVNRAMSRVRSERFESAAALAAAFRHAVLASDIATGPTVETPRLPATRGGAEEPAPAPKKKRRLLPLLSIPLILSCGLTGVGAVSCVACDEAIAEHEMEQLQIRLRPAFARSSKGAEYAEDLARLSRLHDAGETSMWTMSILDTEIEDGLEDGRLDEDELAFVMSRVREAADRGGRYGFSRFWEIIGEDAERQRDRRRAAEMDDKRE